MEAFIDYKSERQNLISGSSGIRNPINQLQELSRLVLHRLFDGDNADVSFAEVFGLPELELVNRSLLMFTGYVNSLLKLGTNQLNY